MNFTQKQFETLQRESKQKSIELCKSKLKTRIHIRERCCVIGKEEDNLGERISRKGRVQHPQILQRGEGRQEKPFDLVKNSP